MEILNFSNLSSLLRLHDNPFSFPNGVHGEQKRLQFDRLAGHSEEKRKLIKSFFKIDLKKFEAYDQFILFGFIGRISHQKGVHLILDVCEQIIKDTRFRALFIIGGMVDGSEYSADCARRLNYLTRMYSQNIWARTENFFTQGLQLTLAADFFLMPSLFEPGGIVQHESLVAGTPVISFNTGGLKDSIREFDPTKKAGNGFIFNNHSAWDFKASIERAISVYKNDKQYQILRYNCSKSFIDLDKVVSAWRGELYRLTKIAPSSKLLLDKMKTSKVSTMEPLLESPDTDTAQLKVTDPYCRYLRVWFRKASDDWTTEYDLRFDSKSNCWTFDGFLPGIHE